MGRDCRIITCGSGWGGYPTQEELIVSVTVKFKGAIQNNSPQRIVKELPSARSSSGPCSEGGSSVLPRPAGSDMARLGGFIANLEGARQVRFPVLAPSFTSPDTIC
jgi:hypothetical protein